jgi:hypothetical protein
MSGNPGELIFALATPITRNPDAANSSTANERRFIFSASM